MPLPPFSSTSSLRPRPKPRIDQTLTLIPNLPNDVAALILSFIPYSHQSRLKTICKSWYVFFSSKTLISLRYNHNHLSHLLCIFPQDPSISSPYLFDPETLSWLPLPLMPCNPHVYGLCNFTAVALGPHLYVLGGSLFDTRSYPLDRPMPTSSAFRFNFATQSWDRLAPMISPRGSFACAAVPSSDQIIVAGGGSRHTLFGAAGSRMSSVERYDVVRDEWVPLDGLPRFRAGCVGFLVGGDEEETKFWVMGGYGESRTVAGVLPVDEYYRDAVVMELRDNGGGSWKEVGDMWGEGERGRLGKIVIVEKVNCHRPDVFMLDGNDILRYNMSSNRWKRESCVPRKAPYDKTFGFVALNGELYVISHLNGAHSTERGCRSRQQNRVKTLLMQIYNPRMKSWRTVLTKPPFDFPLNFNTAVMCTIRL